MMRVLIRSGIGLGWLALVVMGCSGGPAAPSAQSIEASGFGQTLGGIQVVVDPLFGRERASAEFPGGETFEEQSLLPVQVLIENGSRQPVRADRADFRLVRPQNRADVALSPLDAFGMVKPPVGWWAVLPILGPSASAYRNSDWLKQFEARALKDIPVAPGGSAVGLVYFYFPENEKYAGRYPDRVGGPGRLRGGANLRHRTAGTAWNLGRPRTDRPSGGAGPAGAALVDADARRWGGRRRDHP